MGNKPGKITTYLIAVLALLFSPLYFVINVHAANTNTITYVNNGISTTKTYTAGDTITLDTLPAGAIAWTDDNDPDVPNHKMAYVSYDQQLTITHNMVLHADYGSYANGAPGPRLVQFHLELKYYEDNISAFMEFQQQYGSVNAPAGYYIHLPNENYFDPIEFTTNPPVNLDTDLHIHKWVFDASYTGGAVADSTLLHDPSSLILVDPSNYNQIYNVMVDPSYDVVQPAPGETPVVLPSTLPRNAVQFTVSQKDLPEGGGFVAEGRNYIKDNVNDTSTDTYLQRPVNGLTWQNAFSSDPPTTNYDLLPVPVSIPGYTYHWIHDNDTPSLDDVVANGDTTTIPTSYAYILQYVPDTPLLPLVITANKQTVVWDGSPHTVSGYSVDGLTDGDELVFSPRSLNATTSVTGTDVGTYPLLMSPRDFYVRDANGNTVQGKYSINVIGGSLTITPTTKGPVVDPIPPATGSVGPPNTGLSPQSSLKYVITLMSGSIILLAVGWVLLKYKTSRSE